VRSNARMADESTADDADAVIGPNREKCDGHTLSGGSFMFTTIPLELLHLKGNNPQVSRVTSVSGHEECLQDE
jgi:hypothetical protein